MSIIHPRDVCTFNANEVNRRVSYTHKECLSVYSPHRALSDFLSMTRLATNYPLGRESYIRGLLFSPKLLFRHICVGPICALEQDTRFELALPVWKTGVLAANTNPA